jgi:FAD synthase
LAFPQPISKSKKTIINSKKKGLTSSKALSTISNSRHNEYGFNPTVEGESLSLEIHFLDFDEDLYDKKISIILLVPSPRAKN